MMFPREPPAVGVRYSSDDEWTYEGGRKLLQVVTDGNRTVIGDSTYLCMQRGRNAPNWVVPQRLQWSLSLLLGQRLFYLPPDRQIIV